MLNFNVDITVPSPMENSSCALIDNIDQVLISFRNMMEDKVDPTYRHLAKDPCFNAANRLRNIGIYQSSSRNMLHQCMVWMSVRAQTNDLYARMLAERQAYTLIEDAYIDESGYKIIFMVDNDLMKAQILNCDGDELCQIAACM